MSTEPTRVSAGQLRSSVPDVIRQVQKGEEFLLTSYGVPVARIVPLAERAGTPEPNEVEKWFAAESSRMLRLGRLLTRAGYTTVEQIRQARDAELLDIRTLGTGSMRQIRRIINATED